MNKILKYIFITIIILNSCIYLEYKSKNEKKYLKNEDYINPDNKTNDTVKEEIIKESKVSTVQDDSLYLNGTLGLLICKNVYDTITILNRDNSIFTAFTFKGDESRLFYERLDSILRQFKLFAYKSDYALLIFPSNKTKVSFEIFFKNDITKYINLDTELFKFYTWQEFILSDEYISISDENSKFYEKADSFSNEIIFKRKQNEIYFIKGIQVVNDWLKVKAEYENSEGNEMKYKYGWVKWRDSSNILLDFYFLL